MKSGDRPHVIVVGAGFGGLWANKVLRKADVDVTLIDRNNYHTFFPLLYQVAAAELAAGDIAHPIRKIVAKDERTRFLMAEVESIDFEGASVTTDRAQLHYDYLILSPGSTTRHFGVPGAAEHSFPLRTLDHGIRLRNHVLRCFELAASAEPKQRRELLTFLIVGGGPTGVEFAGALQELINGPVQKDHPTLDRNEISVVLLEASDRVLGVYPDRLSRYAAARLGKMGVDVRVETAVERVGPAGVTINGAFQPAATVVWTAGVGGPASLTQWGLPTRNSDRALVKGTLQVAGHDNVFVVGDGAVPTSGTAPMVAQNATQQGTLAARNVLAHIAGDPMAEYSYRDLGNMAVIGRNAAVVHLFSRFPLKGYPAWVMWLALHLAKLIGFRNRLAALMSWSADYLFRDRVARLIIGGQTDGEDTRGSSSPAI